METWLIIKQGLASIPIIGSVLKATLEFVGRPSTARLVGALILAALTFWFFLFPPLSQYDVVQALAMNATVPNFEGYSLADAQMIAEANSITVRPHGDVPEDIENEFFIVQEQGTKAGSTVRRGSIITIEVGRESQANRIYLARVKQKELKWRTLENQNVGLLLYAVEFDADEKQLANIEVYNASEDSTEIVLNFSSPGVFALTNNYRKGDTFGEIAHLDSRVFAKKRRGSGKSIKLGPWDSQRIKVKFGALRKQDFILDYNFDFDTLFFGNLSIDLSGSKIITSKELKKWFDDPERTIDPRLMH